MFGIGVVAGWQEDLVLTEDLAREVRQHGTDLGAGDTRTDLGEHPARPAASSLFREPVEQRPEHITKALDVAARPRRAVHHDRSAQPHLGRQAGVDRLAVGLRLTLAGTSTISVSGSRLFSRA